MLGIDHAQSEVFMRQLGIEGKHVFEDLLAMEAAALPLLSKRQRT